MKRFAQLFARLDATTSTLAKIEAMADYFSEAPAADAAWAVYVLAGRRLARTVAPTAMRGWVAEALALPDWMVETCHATVGDLAETVTLLVDTARVAPPDDALSDRPLVTWVERELMPLAKADDDERRAALTGWWRALPAEQTFLLIKLLTGALRVGVSRKLVVRALARVAIRREVDLDEPRILHRLTGDWSPTPTFFEALLAPAGEDAERPPSQPYPYFLASPLDAGPAPLGQREHWQAEWKWDGIRGQLIRREGETWLWSRGEELVTERFPQVVEAAAGLPDGTVLDGELLAWRDAGPRPFGDLQRRLNRKRVGKKLLAEVPVSFMAYDVMERGGEDIRAKPLRERRTLLEAIVAALDEPRVMVSAVLDAPDWPSLAAARELARERKVEGLMLKRLDSPYRAGRPRGDWWKWKLDPLTIDAVLTYAQPGSGRRATLLTDYSFGLWRDGELVTFAKAYSGLTDEDIAALDRWLRRHTIDRFGPVRQIEPVQVFEIAFEGIRRSTRHKSGVAVRFPRIVRWRQDKQASEADTLAALETLIED